MSKTQADPLERLVSEPVEDVSLWKLERDLRRYYRGLGGSGSTVRFETAVNESFKDGLLYRIVKELIDRRAEAPTEQEVE